MWNIWKDKYFSIGTGETMTFSVVLKDGTSIYTGKAYRKPNESEIKVKINDIIADFLSNNMPSQDQLITGLTSLSLPVDIYNENGLVASEIFRNDWSYSDWSESSANEPIISVVDNGQPIIVSRYTNEDIEVRLTFNDGQTITLSLPVSISKDYLVTDFNLDFAIDEIERSAVNALLDLNNYPNLKEVSLGGVIYQVTANCGSHALYYINAHGGWDTLLITGSVKKKDIIQRYTHKRAYDNSVASNRGKDNYENEITRNYTCNTGWLSDDEAERMHHLLESTNVFLYDIKEGKMMPVVITDNECEYKKFKGEGGKPVRYTINCELAQEIRRR